MNYDAREESRKKIKDEVQNIECYHPEKNKLIKEQEDAEVLLNLEYVRNAASHGSSARSNQNYLEDLATFKELFDSASGLFEKMMKRRWFLA
ncbi:hypothetical protein TKV_c17380 [Thermoanaerobacter kivui]|uniref:MAE-28990/MAE-18760-like HEPN domain-containing protein n=2 Tax=Thermoanaerobacter kivui TaxID=2325 RepID=A0A097ASS9_THEKI|nr:hypothetical protein TKV_c17380 [Thermoanaerobacter kivui]